MRTLGPCREPPDSLGNRCHLWASDGGFVVGAISKFMWLLIRWTGTWASLLQFCNAWTHFSSSNKTQRNCMGPKITTYMPSWGQILDKRYKKTPKNLTVTFKEKKVWRESRGQSKNMGPAHTTT